MDIENFCPHFVDYTRECLHHIDSLHWEMATLVNICTTGDHKDCPFFCFIENPTKACEYFKKSLLRENFKQKNFDEYMELTNKWCLDDFSSCSRYKIRKSHANVENHLHPDGHMMDPQ